MSCYVRQNNCRQPLPQNQSISTNPIYNTNTSAAPTNPYYTNHNNMVTNVPGSTLSGSPIAPSMVKNPEYIPGFLATQIGKKIRIEFLIGTSTLTDRVGTLMGVGASYVLLRLEETDDILMADLYAIKFVTIYH